MTQKLVTVQEAAALLTLSPNTLRAWITERRIEVVRLGRCVRIPMEAIDRLIDGGRVEAVNAVPWDRTRTDNAAEQSRNNLRTARIKLKTLRHAVPSLEERGRT